MVRGQTVWIVSEEWRKVKGYISEGYFEIQECTVDKEPRERYVGYRLITKKPPHKTFYRTKNTIFESYEKAKQEAIRQADKEDELNKLYGFENKLTYRPWEDGNEANRPDYEPNK
jgi:hypothetical protein